MKKTAMLAGAAFTLLAASVNAQTTTTTTTTTDTIPQPRSTMTTVDTMMAADAMVSKDKYNNWSADTYKLQPMPEALTTEKIFPVIGKYQLTDQEGTSSTVSISLDPDNKGIVWVDGLPQGRIQANLRQSPAVYKIPAQKAGEDPAAKDAKQVSEGVLIYDRDANVLNVCLGCTYNTANPAVAFESASAEEETPAAEEAPKKTAKKSAKTQTAKVVKVKPVRYSGAKIIEETAAVQQ